MVAPRPFKYVCPKCGYSRVVIIESDCLTIEDALNMNSTCPKCKTEMEEKELGFFDNFLRK